MIIDLREHRGAEAEDKVLRSFEHLVEGGHLVLIADGDPRSARQSLAERHAGRFTWHVLQPGPDVWRVWLGKVDPTGIQP